MSSAIGVEISSRPEHLKLHPDKNLSAETQAIFNAQTPKTFSKEKKKKTEKKRKKKANYHVVNNLKVKVF